MLSASGLARNAPYSVSSGKTASVQLARHGGQLLTKACGLLLVEGGLRGLQHVAQLRTRRRFVGVAEQDSLDGAAEEDGGHVSQCQ